MKTPEVYYVYWDCASQCELWRGTPQEANDLELGIFGGGNYMMYPCVTGYRITSTIGRDPNGRGVLQVLTCEEL